MTELEHMQQYYLEKIRSLEAKNYELKEEINNLKTIECPLEKDFLGYRNCDYPKQKGLQTASCHDLICEAMEEHNNQIKAYQEILETRRDHEARADERYSTLKQENKRLKEALESIAKGMEINPPNSQVESVVGYFVGFAEAALKGNSV
jgi:hypothetical protein